MSAAVSVSDAATRILDALARHGLLRDRLVPIYPNAKNPARRHANGQWERAESVRYFRREMAEADSMNLGFLCVDLIVLDFDAASGMALYSSLTSEFPVLKETVRAKTGTNKPEEKRGMHVYMTRTPLCEELGIYDKSRSLKDARSGEELQLDIKTVCSTGTGGVVVCHPSPGKEWVVSIADVEPSPIPDALVRWIVAHRAQTGCATVRLILHFIAFHDTSRIQERQRERENAPKQPVSI
jgi:hypothetical protein